MQNHRIIHIADSFEPTYEGLKLRPMWTLYHLHLRFEPTYEGLKQKKLTKQMVATFSFEPTYEGLKLCPPGRGRAASTQF